LTAIHSSIALENIGNFSILFAMFRQAVKWHADIEDSGWGSAIQDRDSESAIQDRDEEFEMSDEGFAIMIMGCTIASSAG
jgi:hypothetical protein